MSVLVKGMEKPEHCGYCRFRYDGICHALQKTQHSMNECPLVVIDDAGLNDTISRQAAIKAICEDGTWLESQGCTDISMAERKQRDADILSDLPSAQPEHRFDEWCTDCKEYDKEKHCCPRFNQVIRTTLQEVQEERKKGTWKREISHYDGAYHLYCSCCGECCGITIDKLNREWNFCPNCGADMRKQKLQYGDEDTSQGGLMSAT